MHAATKQSHVASVLRGVYSQNKKNTRTRASPFHALEDRRRRQLGSVRSQRTLARPRETPLEIGRTFAPFIFFAPLLRSRCTKQKKIWLLLECACSPLPRTPTHLQEMCVYTVYQITCPHARGRRHSAPPPRRPAVLKRVYPYHSRPLAGPSPGPALPSLPTLPPPWLFLEKNNA